MRAVKLTIPACEGIMTALDECHARGFMYKLFGNCTDLKNELNRCLRKARLERTAANREAALEKRAHIKSVWADIDKNS